MPFSIIGRCPRTGQFGAAVAAASVATGARVTHCFASVGAVLTQHRADPRLGQRGLALLRSGYSAQETVDTLVAANPYAPWRQLAVLDQAGRTAAFSGARVQPEMSEAGAEGAIAIGCLLATVRVSAAMLRAFQADPSLPLPERLMSGLEAGLAAGGETKPLRSAHLQVVDTEDFPVVDLRVDWDTAPIAALRELWDRYAPVSGTYLMGALQPNHPSIFTT